MDPKCFVFLAAVVTLCAGVAHEYTVFHQQSNWNPQKFTQNVYESAFEEFSSSPEPHLTPAFDSPPSPGDSNAVGEEINEQCTLYKARLTQKELYFQYIRYKTEIPVLKEFTLCIWMRSENLSNDHTILSYAVDGQPHEIRSWLSNSDRSSYFNLAVGGAAGGGRGGDSVHLFSINYPFRRRRWYHTCQSWSGITGNWLVYVEGERIGAGNSPKTIGRVIRGGGVAVTGQTQSQPGGGFIEEGGYEGEVTLFKLLPRAFSRPLKVADVEGALMYRTSCDGLCKAKTPRPAPIRVRSQPKISETRLSSRAREMLSLSPERPIRVPDMRPTGVSQVRNAYSVKEDEPPVGTPLHSQAPLSFLTQYNNALRRQVIFQTTPVRDGGVQLFYKPGEGSRVSRSLDHFLLDVVPRSQHLPESGFVYRPKPFFVPNAFVPDIDLGHLSALQLHQSIALQKQLNRQLLHRGKQQQQHPCPKQAQEEREVEEQGVKEKEAPAPATPQADEATSASGDEGGRATRLVVLGPEGERARQAAIPALQRGHEPRADATAPMMEVTPVIDWRRTPKKLYAGAMWLRANPVCRKFR